MPKKQYWLFLSLLIASVVLMTYQSQRGIIRPFGFLSYPLNFVNETTMFLSDSVKGTLRRYTLREEELRALRREVRNLRMREKSLEEIALENRRLRELLSLKEQTLNYVATARVIARGADRWSETFVIDEGSKDGVEKDMAVITAEGLLGKVLRADSSYSTVLLLEDTLFSAAVRLGEGRTEAVISGRGPGRCILKYISSDTEVKEGETVVTSGLDALFPPGIEVGFVSKVSTNENESFHAVDVTPFVDTRKVEEVIIVRR
jgi:rod shape-determining protein MreC